MVEKKIDYEEELLKLCDRAGLSYAVFNRYGSMLEAIGRNNQLTAYYYYYLYLIAKEHNSLSNLDVEIAKKDRELEFGGKSYNNISRKKISAVLYKLRDKGLIEETDVKEYIKLTRKGFKKAYQVTNLFVDNLTIKLVEENKLEEWTDYLEKHPDVINFQEEEKVTLSLRDLPKHLFEQLLAEGEKSYIKIVEQVTKSLIKKGHLEKRKAEKIKGYMKQAPIFFGYEPKVIEEQISDFSKYYGSGLSVVSGWITSFSNVRTLDFGSLYSCESNHYYLLFKKRKKNLYCPKCSEALRKVFDIKIPAHQIVIETPNGNYIKAQVSPSLWNPEDSSISTEQKFLIIKLDKSASRSKSITEDLYLVLGIDEEESVKVSKKKAQNVAEQSTKKIISKIRNSLYSKYVGTKKIEEAAVISMASMGTKKVHIKSNRFSNEEINGTINTLIWGKEGTGKSQILRVLNNLVSVNRAASSGFAGSTSIKGLTASYDKDLNAVKAGTIPLNDGFAVLIEELDKFHKKDMRDLLEPFEEKKITYSKAGKQNIFPANTVNLCTANPKKSDLNTEDSYSIVEQIKKEISRPLIDRLDIIVCITKTVSGKEILSEWLKESNREYMKPKTIQNFFLSLQKIKEVYIGPDEIKAFKETIEQHNLKITPRRMNAIMRIAAGISKLHLRDKVETTDIKEAYSYFLKFITTLGEIQADVLSRLESADEITVWAEKVKDLFEEIPERHIEEIKAAYNINESQAKEALNKLQKEGEIFSMDGKTWRKTEK